MSTRTCVSAAAVGTTYNGGCSPCVHGHSVMQWLSMEVQSFSGTVAVFGSYRYYGTPTHKAHLHCAVCCSCEQEASNYRRQADTGTG